jgi:hypothetical protein
MSLKFKVIVGSLLNLVVFGAADAVTGRFDRGLKKFALFVFITVVVALLEELISGALEGWIIWGYARVFLFVALYDGVFTILRANDVAL